MGDNPAGAKLCIIAPPGSGKTQLVGVGFMAWMIGRYPERHAGLLSYADQVGWARSRAIKQLIESNKAYKLVFPYVVPDKRKWGDTEFVVKDKRNKVARATPHPTLRAGGVNSAVVSYRFNGLLYDDPHDEKNVTTPAAREKVRQNYQNTVKTRLTSDAWQVVIGTRWADDDLIGYVTKQKSAREWKIVHIPALSANGRSYWPEAYPFEYLEEIRYAAPQTFAVQYLGDTSGGEAGLIKTVRTYLDPPEVVAQKRGLVIGVGWDTAMKKGQDNDYSVGYVAGMDQYGQIFVLDRAKGKWTLPELLDEVTALHAKWNPSNHWVEDTANGTAAVQTLMSQSSVPMVAQPYKGDKYQRANALAPYLHGGHVLLSGYSEWYKDAEYELTHFPYTSHDDDLDALFIVVMNLLEMRHPASYYNRPKVNLRIR